jgi:hypothetical protein
VTSITLGPTVCTVPSGHKKLAREGKVFVWQGHDVASQGSGDVYACSPQHPKGVKLLSVSAICESPTGCGDESADTSVRIVGRWVAVAVKDDQGDYGGVAVWDTHASKPALVHSINDLDLVQGPYDLALRADGAAAYAYQTIGGGGATDDLLYACESDARGLRRIAKFVEPESYQGTRALLTGVRFGGGEVLLCTERGELESAQIP